MFKSKIAIVAVAAMLAMCMGLTACGGSSSSSAAASSSAASSASASASASSSAASSSADSIEVVSSLVVFWQGTLPDGRVVTYVDNAEKGEAAIAIAKSDFSDGKVWAGPVNYVEGGTITIAGADTVEPITFTFADINDNSIKINIAGYGEVEMKPVTEDDITAYAKQFAEAVAAEGEKLLAEIESAAKQAEQAVEAEIAKLSSSFEAMSKEFDSLDDKTVFFWDGKMADGSYVDYVNDPSGKAFLSVIKADYSDGAMWYGAATTSQDGKTVTITDDESKATVTFSIAESTDTTMKINIMGYGEADLTAFTKADLVKLSEDFAKSLS